MKISFLFVLRLIVALILIQSLYFKFTGHPEAMYIFSTLDAEPWGRRVLGVIELIIGLTLLFPKTQLLASFGALGLMIGAIGTHLFTPVGIVIKWDGNSDHGELFIMACIAFFLSLINLILYAKKQNLSLIQLITKEVLKRSR